MSLTKRKPKRAKKKKTRKEQKREFAVRRGKYISQWTPDERRTGLGQMVGLAADARAKRYIKRNGKTYELIEMYDVKSLASDDAKDWRGHSPKSKVILKPFGKDFLWGLYVNSPEDSLLNGKQVRHPQPLKKREKKNSPANRKLRAYVKKWYDSPEIRNNYVIFYHGTPLLYAHEIRKTGLKGGYNLTGGTHGVFDKPLLYLARSKSVASKYGTVFEVRIPLSKFKKFGQKMTVSVDGLGDRVYIMKASERGEVLIPPAYLKHIDHIPQPRGVWEGEPEEW